MSMCYYFGKESLISVCIEDQEDAKIRGREKRKPTLNWSCIGATSIKRAEEFAKDLKQAITFAKKKE